MKPPFKTIIIDDKQSEIKALQTLLTPYSNIFNLAATAGSLDVALKAFEEQSFDVAIIDYKLDGTNDCLQLMEQVSSDRRKITVFKTITDYSKILHGLYRNGHILFLSSFYTEDSIEDFVDNVVRYYKRNYSEGDNTIFFLKTADGGIVPTPVNNIYVMKTLLREYTMFHLFDETGKYRPTSQSGRMQDHIIKINTNDLFVATRGVCVNLRNVRELAADNTIVFKNNDDFPDSFPKVKVANERINDFLSSLLKMK